MNFNDSFPGKTVFLLLWMAAGNTFSDPLDTVYWKTFYINTIGVGTGVASEGYRQSMLTNTGGMMPYNIKAGFGAQAPKIGRAAGGYYDYLPSVSAYRDSLNAGRRTDMTIGTHLNALPWSDSADQSVDILHNYLEKYDNGSLLQKDRNGLIRNSSLDQDPTIDETGDSFAFLEMQLTLSPYAPLVHDYILRNTRLAARYFAWLREDAPDIVTFCTLTSETGQNIRNGNFSDYSEWSKQEFHDWLSGSGIYDGKAQYSSISELNSTFGLSYSSWDDVEPPTTVSWNSTSTGLWWQKWHEFRVAQVQHFEQSQMTATREAGWNPDRLFGHQQPGGENDTSDILYTMKATPLSTTFVNDGGNGVTTYGDNAVDTDIFNALYADDKSWGLVEYNPNLTTVAENMTALDSVFNAHAHIICPFHWTLTDNVILGSELETALQQFLAAGSNSAYSGLAEYETTAESRSALWTMSYSSDIETSAGWSSLNVSTGVCYATFGQPSASMDLELDENRHTLISDGYHALSARIFFSNAPSGDLVFQWTDTDNAVASVSVPVEQGWNLCRVNLSELSDWREKEIKNLKLTFAGGAGNSMELDWVQLQACPCWHFNEAGEVTSVRNYLTWSISDGSFTGTGSTGDHYFYLAVDDDRRFIDTERYDRVRIRMTSSTSGTGQFYWWTEDLGYSAVNFSVSAGTHTYELNLSATPRWTGIASKLRLDPVNQAGATCSIDYIALSSLMLPPRTPVYNPIINSPNPVFTWTPGTEPDNSSFLYEFQLATDFGFTNKLINLSGLTNAYHVYIGDSIDGFYWWRVRARRSGTGFVSPWMVPMPLFVNTWDGNSTNDFVNRHSISNITVSNGIWTAQTGSDPYFDLNSGWVDSGDAVNADIYKTLQVRLKISASGTSSDAQFFYFPLDGGTYATTFSVPPDDEWHECTLDLSSLSNWTGMMKRVRLDPTIYSGATVSIDWVRFMPESDGDLDDDGIADSTEGSGDPDNDGLENYRDPDSDGDFMSDADENAAGRNPYDASDIAFHFNTDDDFEGWTNWANITNAAVSDGILSAQSTSTDPYLYTTNCAFSSDQIETIYYKLRGETNALAVFYWKHDEDSAWKVQVVNYTNSPDWQVCAFHVSNSSNWTGTITCLRVDPATSAANQTFAYDWILASDGDLDNDGVPDAFDGLDSTNSTGLENFRNADKTSSPMLIHDLGISSVVQMQMTGYSGYTYILKRSDSLTSPEWITVQAIGPLTANQMMTFEDNTATETNAFYRIFSE
ncbi:hypothetical protein [Tichowtungia aerotolerans]|uniref:Uncharacterized protein n=1 Tax=Tichowtungia aerotolerans TaxID=2697043 RepID=A0A6P1M4S0_9BACT|nr:hypothetical protein [Tichowtungia aerotolerans]QHI69789.1 hypothetical protein GT409_10120 [Tichowtungia aerotolerans]